MICRQLAHSGPEPVEARHGTELDRTLLRRATVDTQANNVGNAELVLFGPPDRMLRRLLHGHWRRYAHLKERVSRSVEYNPRVCLGTVHLLNPQCSVGSDHELPGWREPARQLKSALDEFSR